MNNKHRRSPMLLALIILLLTGCAPVISRSTLKDVNREIAFADIIKNPSAFKGNSVILGGRVILLSNGKDTTLIEVLQFPLSHSMKPLSRKGSGGRFIISAHGFLDPLVYRGKLITVAGALEAPITKDLGKAEYTYPLIKSRELHLWKYGADRASPISIGIGLGISGGY